jgi:LacI family transcriptional regulator
LVASLTAPDACLRGVARYARQQGWHLVTDMLFTGTFPRGWKGDGIVALAAYQTDLIRHIQASGAPCVSIAISDEPLSFASVRGDQVAVGRMAAEHLLERAYRNFAWAPFIGDQINRDRFLGFETHLAEHGRTCQVLLPMHRRIGGFWHDDWGGYRRALLARLAKLPRPTAVFAANDCVAAEITDACHELDIAVPDEIAVLGVGNDERLCEAASVPISSVALDLEEMAYRAAEALDEIMRGGAVPNALVVSPKRVVTRLSTDNRAVGNSQVARALSYIAEHFPERTLSVAEVATAPGAHFSRRDGLHCARSDHKAAHARGLAPVAHVSADQGGRNRRLGGLRGQRRILPDVPPLLRGKSQGPPLGQGPCGHRGGGRRAGPRVGVKPADRRSPRLGPYSSRYAFEPAI